MANHTTSEHCHVIDSCLTNHLMHLYLKLEQIRPAHEPETLNTLVSSLSYALQLTNQWLSWKNGCLVTQPPILHDVSCNILVVVTDNSKCKSLFFNSGLKLWLLVQKTVWSNYAAPLTVIHTGKLLTNLGHFLTMFYWNGPIRYELTSRVCLKWLW